MDTMKFNKSMEQECKKLFPNYSSKDWDKIGDNGMQIMCGTINLLTGESKNVQEIHFDSLSETTPSKF